MEKELYKIKVTNTIGDMGVVSSTTSRTIQVSPTLGVENGFNPGELIAFSWATCLEATLRYVKKLRGISFDSYTEVTYTMTYDENTPKGLKFLYHADVYMDTKDTSLIEMFLLDTHKRCPVSKILDDQNITIKGHAIKK
jgi:lipoyl-dependent peroxiredoxin